jgi:hypothetical protein
MLHDGWIKAYQNLKSWIVTFCLWNTKNFCKALVGAPNHSKWTKNQEENMGLSEGKKKKKNSPQGSTTFIKYIKSKIKHIIYPHKIGCNMFLWFFFASLEHEKLWMAISFSFLHPIEPFEGLRSMPPGMDTSLWTPETTK